MYSLPANCVEHGFADLLSYWDAKRRDGLLPARRDIDPLDLPPALLPQVLLFDVIRHPARLRFRFRIAGTAFTTLAGRDVTGLIFDEVGAPDRVGPVNELLTAVAESGRPGFLAGRVTVRQDSHQDIGRLALPLATDGRNVDMILGMWLTRPPAAQDAFAAPTEPFEGKPQLLVET